MRVAPRTTEEAPVISIYDKSTSGSTSPSIGSSHVPVPIEELNPLAALFAAIDAQEAEPKIHDEETPVLATITSINTPGINSLTLDLNVALTDPTKPSSSVGPLLKNTISEGLLATDQIIGLIPTKPTLPSFLPLSLPKVKPSLTLMNHYL
ncbi:hypothetical protein L6452_34669 [Arctium lappa]|uniref:Uncharacterized protein n=1 Tax=Arctium lappa TaxID=4217 RepID=A0ACB8YIU4_ARCLA|nr:hypothetical protein L6452_34669 [Arctium lappa]